MNVAKSFCGMYPVIRNTHCLWIAVLVIGIAANCSAVDVIQLRMDSKIHTQKLDSSIAWSVSTADKPKILPVSFGLSRPAIENSNMHATCCTNHGIATAGSSTLNRCLTCFQMESGL